MIRIALTGSIGMGKSTVAKMFEAAGAPVFDADAVVHQLQGPGGALLERIGELFPGCVRAGTLDRECLVRDWRDAFIASHSDEPGLIFEIPLLFETGGEKEFDKVIVVSAPPEVQRSRVLARHGMNEAKFNAILARQIPDVEKRRRADFVIDTGIDLSTTEAQVREILACLGLGGR
jgi:dephospho-CoA kinase